MKRISEHISFREATKSHTAIREGIDNTPSEHAIEGMKLLANKVLEPMRAGLGNRPIWYASFYRCSILNSLVGGALNSQHQAKARPIIQAATDIDNDDHPESPTNRECFYYILENLEFDQLIWEYGDNENPDWVHVSFKETGNRKQVLRALPGKRYIPFEL